MPKQAHKRAVLEVAHQHLVEALRVLGYSDHPAIAAKVEEVAKMAEAQLLQQRAEAVAPAA